MLSTAILDPDPLAWQHTVASLDHAPGRRIAYATGDAETLLPYLHLCGTHCAVILVEPWGQPKDCNRLASALSAPIPYDVPAPVAVCRWFPGQPTAAPQRTSAPLCLSSTGPESQSRFRDRHIAAPV